MTPQELRIGNWVMDRRGNEFQIDHWETRNKVSAKSNATMCMGVLMETHPLTEYVDYLKPIPLTEEWLLKFGFEKQDNNWKTLNLNFATIGWERLAGITLSFEMESIYLPHIEYVHQLQNLYFALTNEELKLQNNEKQK